MIEMTGRTETVNINVLIADRTYPLKVSSNDAPRVQKAVQLVDGKIKEYQKLYDGKDKQDYLAMCLLNFAVEHVNLESKHENDNRLLEEKINELGNILTAH